jgi:8-oxo-dGTP pyrophosphatase MutT (NUDIX family)
VPKQAKKVFSGKIYDVYQWEQEMFDGSLEVFEMLKRPDTIEVLAVKNNKIIVLKEEQPSILPYLGLPGGRHDHEEEDELSAAKREVLEETGMSFRSWKLLRVVQPHAKIEQFLYCFLATDFSSKIEQKLDSGEKITVLEYSFEEVKEIVNKPEVRCMAKDILNNCNNLDELLNYPEYETSKTT